MKRSIFFALLIPVLAVMGCANQGDLSGGEAVSCAELTRTRDPNGRTSIDIDDDGTPDFSYCLPQRIDEDMDGERDGLDIDCDGVIDIRRRPAGAQPGQPGQPGDPGPIGEPGQPGQPGQASCATNINGSGAQCTSTDGGATWDCGCLEDNIIVRSCTHTGNNACSSPGGCCF